MSRQGNFFIPGIRSGALVVALISASIFSAGAQPAAKTEKGPPNPLQGFSQNNGQPIQIEAAHLEVRDKQKVATFTGNVKVVQGDTTMRCKSLVVHYEPKTQDGQSAPPPPSTTPAGPGGSSQISKIEMNGGVTVVQKDQTASGDSGLYDMKSNTVTLKGNVTVSQGQNILRGDRLVVDMTTGRSVVDAGKGPVRMLIHQQPQTPGSQTPGSPASSGPPAHKFGPQRSSSSTSSSN
jgi:lipopolysaccharide export system protein LptA